MAYAKNYQRYTQQSTFTMYLLSTFKYLLSVYILVIHLNKYFEKTKIRL